MNELIVLTTEFKQLTIEIGRYNRANKFQIQVQALFLPYQLTSVFTVITTERTETSKQLDSCYVSII